jgi:hypothetical protein
MDIILHPDELKALEEVAKEDGIKPIEYYWKMVGLVHLGVEPTENQFEMWKRFLNKQTNK